MTWIKIKYLQFNKLETLKEHSIPLLYKNFNHYKIETKISDKCVVYIYINLLLINNNSYENKKLIELLNYTKYNFKFNKYYFNKYCKYIIKPYSIIDKLNTNILIKCVDNNIITLNNTVIDLSKKNIVLNPIIKHTSLNTYFIFNLNKLSKFLDKIAKCNKKTLVIIPPNYMFNTKYNSIVLDHKFRDTIVNKIDYDIIVIINCLPIILEQNYFKIINKLGCKNIFIEDDYTFDYENYIHIKNMIFDKKINNDLNLNQYFIKNNIILYYSKFNNIKTTVIRTTTTVNMPTNINIYGNLFIFENSLKKHNITYDLCVDNTATNIKCGVSGTDLSNEINVVFKCKHTVSMITFLNHINYNSLCPICNLVLNNTVIILKGTKDTVVNTLLSKNIITNICININTSISTSKKLFNIVILNNKLNYNTLENSIYLNNRLKKINNLLNNSYKMLFIPIDNFDNYIKHITNKVMDFNIYVIYETSINSVIKYKILNSMENLNISNKSTLNLIKCN